MHLGKSVSDAIQRLGGRISRAVEKLLKNELDYERAKSGTREGQAKREGTRRDDSDVERFVSEGGATLPANDATTGPRPRPRKATNGRH